MIMANPKTYLRPNTLDDLLALLPQPDALITAGGALAFGLLDIPYETIIDLESIPALRETESAAGGYRLGSAVMLSQIAELPALDPVMRSSLTRAIPLNVRSRLSLIESLMYPAHPMLSEWLAALAALDATTHWLTMQRERRTLRMSELLMHEEAGSGLPGILLQVDLAQPSARTEALGAAFVARTPADEPIVNAAVCIAIDDDARVRAVRAAVGGVDYTGVILVDLTALAGQPLDPAHIAQAASEMMQQLDPIDDWRGSAEYRREMARVCVQRALHACMERMG